MTSMLAASKAAATPRYWRVEPEGTSARTLHEIASILHENRSAVLVRTGTEGRFEILTRTYLITALAST